MFTKTFLPTERDQGLLTELGEVGLMSTAMLVERHFRGFAKPADAHRSFRRRLRLFEAVGLIESTQVAVRHRSGSTNLAIHTLTAPGAELVAELTGARPRRAATSLDLSPVTLPHRLGVIATRLAFDDAFRAARLSPPDWIHEYDLCPGVDPRSSNQEKFILYEAFQQGGQRLVCWSDAAGRITLSGQPGHHLLVYLEYDRSTETAKQLAAKAEPFDLLVRERRYEQHWPSLAGQVTVRVLFVCRSHQRVGNAIDAIRPEPGAELFRFATYDDLKPFTLLTAPIWRTTAGEFRAIIRRATDRT